MFFSALVFQFSGCSLGFLISKNQSVTIVKDSLATMKINKKDPDIKENKYILPRNGEAQQVVLTRDSFKTQYSVCVPHKFSGEGIATVAINAALIGVPFTAFSAAIDLSSIIPFALVSGTVGAYWGYVTTYFNPKFWEYDRVIYLNNPMIRIPYRDSLSKEIRLNKVAIDLSPEKSEDYMLNYKDYKSGKIKGKVNFKAENGTKIDDTYLSDELNSILKKNGFIDTTGLVLKSNYNQNAYLDATIIGSKYYFIQNVVRSADLRKTGFINVVLDIKWDILDFYKKPIFSDTIQSKSGEFLSYISAANSNFNKDAFKDAMEVGMYTLLNKEKFRTAMRLPKANKTDTLKLLEIQDAKAFVSTIEQAVQASVTIKSPKGHGSGFFISENGYIVTNYHVIADTAKLEIVLNDGSKCIPKIIRVNKESDLALLKVEKNNIVPFKIPLTETSAMGKEIYVIGTPSAEDLSQTLSKGIISSIRKQSNGSKLIQTDASISGGNSGGPLIDKEGKLIGIVNAKLVGMGIEGISFAIPANEIGKSLIVKFK